MHCDIVFGQVMYSLIIELDNLIAVLLQVVQMFNLIFVTFYRLSISLLKVDIFHSKQLLFVIEDLVDLKGTEHSGHSLTQWQPQQQKKCLGMLEHV